MTKYTNHYNLPYPEGADEVVVHQDMEALARRVDVAVGGVKREVDHDIDAQSNRLSQAELAVSQIGYQVDGIHSAVEESSAYAQASASSSNSAWEANDALIPRVEHIEAIAGLAPGEVTDAQTANLISQGDTSTQAALRGFIRTRDALVNVRDFGAAGDGSTDDTDAIQAAVDFVHEYYNGGIVFVPSGTYLIKAHVDHDDQLNYLHGEGGIQLHDNITFKVNGDAEFRAIPNGQRAYNIVQAYGRRNVIIEGGKYIGERYEHTGSTGQWGHGISVLGGENITIRDVHCSDMWGDGINIQAYEGNGGREPVRGLTVDRVTCDNNRRQGMSLSHLTHFGVRDSSFINTNGSSPESGLDIEPGVSWDTVNTGVIENCRFNNNVGPGITMFNGDLYNITFRDCEMLDNESPEGDVSLSDGRNITVDNCRITGLAVLTRSQHVQFINTSMRRALINKSQDVNYDHVDIYDPSGTASSLFSIADYSGSGEPSRDITVTNSRLRGFHIIRDNEYTGTPLAFSIYDGENITISNTTVEDVERIVMSNRPALRFHHNRFINIGRGLAALQPQWEFVNNMFEGVPSWGSGSAIQNRPAGNPPGDLVIIGNIGYAQPINASDQQLGMPYSGTNITQSDTGVDAVFANNYWVQNN